MNSGSRDQSSVSASCRGQASIGSVIVLIAALLIAVTTAGVFFDIMGGFESDAESAGEKSADQISSRLEVVAATGYVDNATDTVDEVALVVQPSVRDRNIDLTGVVVGSTIGTGSSVAVDSTAAVTLVALEDDDGSLSQNVLNSATDTAAVRVDVERLWGEELAPGDSADVRLITPGGASTTVALTAPSSLSGRDTVAL